MMTDEQKRARIQRALNTEFAHLNTTPCQRERLLAHTIGGENMNHNAMIFLGRKSKLGFALMVLLIMLCLSVTAYAVGAIINGYYEKVAELDAEGSMIRWQLEDKISFVNVMREFELTMNEDDYAVMNNPALSDEEREAAADRIIYDRYGALIQEDVAGWAQQPDSITEIAPNEDIIFLERYMAEHPESINTQEDYIAYTDALGYFRRDVYYPALRAAMAQLPQETPIPKGTEADAIDWLKNDMTEILGWDGEAVNAMVPEVKWDEEYQMWEVSGEVSKESMANAFEPILEGPTVEETETGYRLTILVDTKGNQSKNSLDKEAFRAKHANDIEPMQKMTHEEGEKLAYAAILKQFSLTEEELNKLFCSSEYIGLGKDNAQLCRYVYHVHYLYAKENKYEATVNLLTGEVTDVHSLVESQK